MLEERLSAAVMQVVQKNGEESLAARFVNMVTPCGHPAFLLHHSWHPVLRFLGPLVPSGLEAGFRRDAIQRATVLQHGRPQQPDLLLSFFDITSNTQRVSLLPLHDSGWTCLRHSAVVTAGQEARSCGLAVWDPNLVDVSSSACMHLPLGCFWAGSSVVAAAALPAVIMKNAQVLAILRDVGRARKQDRAADHFEARASPALGDGKGAAFPAVEWGETWEALAHRCGGADGSLHLALSQEPLPDASTCV